MEFESREKAKKILRSIQADDQGFVKSHLKEKHFRQLLKVSLFPH